VATPVVSVPVEIEVPVETLVLVEADSPVLTPPPVPVVAVLVPPPAPVVAVLDPVPVVLIRALAAAMSASLIPYLALASAI
jgi:hypothetical protein